MKIDKYAKDVFKRLEGFSSPSSSYPDSSAYSHSEHNNGNAIVDDDGTRYEDPHDDEYYLDIDSTPPRFAYYRHVRVENCTDEWRKKTLECVWDTITQDELDYYLRAKLREPPEDRYQHQKEAWYFHESSYYHRNNGNGGYDGYGCNNGECIPECRFYPEYGRIEDEEVIADHKEFEERYRKRNAIVEPPSDSELLKLAEIYHFP